MPNHEGGERGGVASCVSFMQLVLRRMRTTQWLTGDALALVPSAKQPKTTDLTARIARPTYMNARRSPEGPAPAASATPEPEWEPAPEPRTAPDSNSDGKVMGHH